MSLRFARGPNPESHPVPLRSAILAKHRSRLRLTSFAQASAQIEAGPLDYVIEQRTHRKCRGHVEDEEHGVANAGMEREHQHIQDRNMDKVQALRNAPEERRYFMSERGAEARRVQGKQERSDCAIQCEELAHVGQQMPKEVCGRYAAAIASLSPRVRAAYLMSILPRFCARRMPAMKTRRSR